MYKNTAGQYLFPTVISSVDGSPKTSGVDFYVTIDDGSQAEFAGTESHVGNGVWRLTPTQAETNGNCIGFSWSGTGVLSGSITVFPVTKKASDPMTLTSAYDAAKTAAPTTAQIVTAMEAATTILYALNARLTANRAGYLDKLNLTGSIADNVKTAIEAAGSHLALLLAIGNKFSFGGTESMLLAQSTNMRGTDSALTAAGYTAPANSDIAAIKLIADILNGLIEDSDGDRFTAKALETAPAGGDGDGGPWSEVDKDAVLDNLAALIAMAYGNTRLDITTTPWQMVVVNSTTDEEIGRWNLLQADGSNVTSTAHIIGRYTRVLPD